MSEKNTDSQAAFTFLITRFKPVLAAKSWQELEQFHKNNKYLLMGLDPENQKILGRIVSTRQGISPATAIADYLSGLEKVREKSWEKGRLINMCLHVFGYFRNQLTATQKAIFIDLIDSYENGTIGINPVIAQLHEWAVTYNQNYLTKQTIFEFF